MSEGMEWKKGLEVRGAEGKAGCRGERGVRRGKGMKRGCVGRGKGGKAEGKMWKEGGKWRSGHTTTHHNILQHTSRHTHAYLVQLYNLQDQ